MSRTIVQAFGPIYGEPVNGTVQGRPNGSVYVPLSNTVNLTLIEDHRYFAYRSATGLWVSDSTGNFVTDLTKVMLYSANSQDLASNVMLQLYSDSELTTMVGSNTQIAGVFNGNSRFINDVDPSLTDGQKLYLRAQLLNNGTPVATSDVIEVVMVVP